MPYLDERPLPLARLARILGADPARYPSPVPRSAERAGGGAGAAARGGADVVVAEKAGAEVASDRPVLFRDEGLEAEAAVVVAQIESIERSKARLEARLLGAYAALHTIEEQQLARLPRSSAPLSADQVVTREISCATGVGEAEVSRRLELATAPRRHRVLHERLRRGTVGLYRALQIVGETRYLDDHVLPDLETTVLAPAPDGSVASQRLFTSRLRRCVRSADQRAEEARRCAASRRRTAHGRITEDGMGTFTVTATAERVVGVLDRADTLARAIRAAGDERTLDQLRSDVLCDLALFGTVAPSPPTVAPQPESVGGPLAGPGSVDMTEWLDVPPAPVPTCGSWLVAAPPATVRIVVPFEVAAGLSDAACEIPGHGWVTAAHARRIITAPGSVWQRLAVEVDSGRALELSTDRYAPTREMVEHVRAVDGVCRAPGCQVPAERCDLDHIVPWPRGETRVSNFESLSRGCHNPKTAGAWTAERVADSGVRWQSLAGREYVTYPKDWREVLRDPGAGPPTDFRSHRTPTRPDAGGGHRTDVTDGTGGVGVEAPPF